MKILITGSAGFIGFHLSKALLAKGEEVVGIDNLNHYYDPQLKYGRLTELGFDKNKCLEPGFVTSSKYPKLRFLNLDFTDKEKIFELFKNEKFNRVCHLGGQAGVRYSITHPDSYIQSNIIGFFHILEACRYHQIEHFVYASSSSVYGLNENMPFSTADNVDHPVSLYAATKKSNELMAHSYSHLYQMPTTGLRFFTVYGPWGRPDMALFLFTRQILEGKPIEVYNFGDMQRDFTYVDDIVTGIVKVLDHAPKPDPTWSGKDPDPSKSKAPYKIYNIGNSSPVKLMYFIEALEKALGKTAVKKLMPVQAGDVLSTWADVSDLEKNIGYKPATQVQEGINEFVKWYKWFYKL